MLFLEAYSINECRLFAMNEYGNPIRFKIPYYNFYADAGMGFVEGRGEPPHMALPPSSGLFEESVGFL